MAFKSKVDYFGIGSIDGLTITSTSENKSAGVAEARDENGFVIASQPTEEQEAPACDYVVTGNVSMSNIILGNVVTHDGKRYCLGEVSISTSAGSAPTVACSGQKVETDANFNSCTAKLPTVTLSPLHHAQTFGAFTISGTGAHLTQSSFSATSTVSTATKDGEVLAHDITDARVTVTGTIQVSDPSYGVPTVTPTNGWTLTSPLTETNPDADYPTYTFGLTSYLTAIEPNS